MSWNYRVVRRRASKQDPETGVEKIDYWYAIHEAYYDDAGRVIAITENSIAARGDTVAEARHSWVMMVEAFGKPILDFDEIPEKEAMDWDEDPAEGEEPEDFPDGWEEWKSDISDEELADFEASREQARKDAEDEHLARYVGTSTLAELVKNIMEDFASRQVESDKPLSSVE